MAMRLMVAGRRVVSRLWHRMVARMAEVPTEPAMVTTVRLVVASVMGTTVRPAMAMATMAGLAMVLTLPTTVALAMAPTARP